MIFSLQKGGLVSHLILVCSIFALAAFLERLIKIKRAKIDADKFLSEIEYLIKIGNKERAVKLCDLNPSPVSRIVRTALVNFTLSREKIMDKLEEVALRELPRLEKNLGILPTVAHIAPLLGLLGTVNGMIKIFRVIEAKSILGPVSPGDLAAGIWMALLTTAFGLTVAIPTIVAYAYLHHDVQSIKVDMERAASVILNSMK